MPWHIEERFRELFNSIRTQRMKKKPTYWYQMQPI